MQNPNPFRTATTSGGGIKVSHRENFFKGFRTRLDTKRPVQRQTTQRFELSDIEGKLG